MSTKDKIWKLLEEIPDPEIPVLTIHDLGIVRKIDEINNEIGDAALHEHVINSAPLYLLDAYV